MKKCPVCAEEIQDEAIKCRHCGEVVIDGDLRELCFRVSRLSESEAEVQLALLPAGQRERFHAAFRALGYNSPQAREAPPPISGGTTLKTGRLAG